MVESTGNVAERRLSSVAQPMWLQSNKQTTHTFDLTPEEDNTTPSDEGEQFQIHRDFHSLTRSGDSKLLKSINNSDRTFFFAFHLF